MALQKNIMIMDNQINVENAYLKITSLQIVTGGVNKACTIHLSSYKDKCSADENLSVLESKCESFIPVFGNEVKDIKAQAYEYLKTLDEYKDATDLLDE